MSVEEILIREYKSLISKPNQVLAVFNHQFGEHLVDLQGIPTLEEFLKFTLEVKNIPELYTSYGHRLSTVQESVFNKFKSDKDADLSLNNIEIREAFYNDLIIKTIGRLFNHITLFVLFPEVKVTNEHNRSHVIKNFFAKIQISVRGVLIADKLTFARSFYTKAEFSSQYTHSHVGSLDHGNPITFKTPCMGSGPIRDTYMAISDNFDIDRWSLFAYELSVYVTVESIAGGPYRRLENITIGGNNTTIIKDFKFNEGISLRNHSISRKIMEEYLSPFLVHFLNLNLIKFNYVNGSYGIGMSFVDFTILISNSFIQWVNMQAIIKKESVNMRKLKEGSYPMLKEYLVTNNSLIIPEGSTTSLESHIRNATGRTVCTFKGNRQLMRIEDVVDISQPKSLLLNVVIINMLATNIITLININHVTDTKSGASSSISNSQGYSHSIKGDYQTL